MEADAMLNYLRSTVRVRVAVYLAASLTLATIVQAVTHGL